MLKSFLCLVDFIRTLDSMQRMRVLFLLLLISSTTFPSSFACHSFTLICAVVVVVIVHLCRTKVFTVASHSPNSDGNSETRNEANADRERTANDEREYNKAETTAYKHKIYFDFMLSHAFVSINIWCAFVTASTVPPYARARARTLSIVELDLIRKCSLFWFWCLFTSKVLFLSGFLFYLFILSSVVFFLSCCFVLFLLLVIAAPVLLLLYFFFIKTKW